MDYEIGELNIDPISRMPWSIQYGNLSIPLCQDNVDFCRFWLWNSANDYPIELPEDFIGTLDLAKITALGSDH
jgi:hypothetical protein